MLKSSRDALARLRRAGACSLLRALGRSDRRRWSDPASLNRDWEERTRLLAAMIPAGASVLEFGAGARALQRYLPTGCRYTPSDLVDRGPGTLVCDLNARPLPRFDPHDVMVFAGVLTYLYDLPGLLGHLTGSCRQVLASYPPADRRGWRDRMQRRSNGWVNDYTAAELHALFATAGFTLIEERSWGAQKVCRYARPADEEARRRGLFAGTPFSQVHESAISPRPEDREGQRASEGEDRPWE